MMKFLILSFSLSLSSTAKDIPKAAANIAAMSTRVTAALNDIAAAVA